MSPEVIGRKLDSLFEILKDLKPHAVADRHSQRQKHYEIERLLQLAVDLSIAIGRRVLLLKKIDSPDSARDVFITMGANRIISKKLAAGLADAVGLRNILVHEYQKIDEDILFGGLKNGFQNFRMFAKKMEKFV